ncbi:mastermind-like protein 2 isoform X2 [Polypterus senegalus]|uniref:mastermind-like protein 2 isoform X2 n=1 Tax=Polypterus senegalus TaxID=55291 RepID=UPI0019664B53|nr:mastermind-like protein 2 isoform X2 [Polypterus senegalus]
MGEAAPPQPPAGSFVPLLGGVPGPGNGSRGSAVPQLHSAIVERLRARIELCRRHHTSCENRYQRGQAESSDRERESTLQLLNIVHQGPGSRKTKHGKAASQPQQALAPPPQSHEFNGRANGEQKPQRPAGAPEEEHRNPTRIAGLLRRKLEGNPPPGYNSKPNGISDASFVPNFKRVRVDESIPLGHGGCTFNNGESQTMSGAGTMAHAILRKDERMLPPSCVGDMFSLTLKEMKKEPGEVHSCVQASSDHIMTFDFKDEPGSEIDPDLQDLFDELTKTVPTMSDLEFEKMLNTTIKQDEPFNSDISRQTQASLSKPSPPLEKMVIKTEYTPSFSQAPVMVPQLRPSSSGPTFSLTKKSISPSPVLSVPQNHNQVSQGPSGPTRSVNNWPEVSHSEHLKQIAASQQPTAMLHHRQQQQPQQQNQAAAVATSWASTLSTRSSPGSFRQEKNPSPASLCSQRISPQNSIMTSVSNSHSREVNNCLFKVNTSASSMDTKVLNIKPLPHFGSKLGNQSMSMMVGSQGKSNVLSYTPQQQQQQPPQASVQNQSHHPAPFQNHTMPHLPNVNLALQPKGLPEKMQINLQPPALLYKMGQHRQPQPSLIPGSHPPADNGFLNTTSQTQQQINHQKIMGKAQVLQRQLALQAQIIADPDKMSPQDQLNRHLTRPPPDYKQSRRGPAGIHSPSQYSGGGSGLSIGINSSQSLTNTASNQGSLQTSSCQIVSQGTKMVPVSNDKMYVGSLDPQQGAFNLPTGVAASQQHGNQNQIAVNQNNPRFQAPGNLVDSISFVSAPVASSQHMRPPVNQKAAGLPGQRFANMMISSGMMTSSWASSEGAKQTLTSLIGCRRFPNTLQSHQPLQSEMANQHFAQQSMAPPNHMDTNAAMRTINPVNQTTLASVQGPTPRPNQPRMTAMPTMGSMNQMTQSQSITAGTFPVSNHNTQSFSGSSQSNDMSFDFLQQGDNTVPVINSDSDFIDSLLKSGTGNDDWMKDINLDEILGSHS